MRSRLAARVSYVVRRGLRAIAEAPFGAVTVTLTVALALFVIGGLSAVGELGRRGLDAWGRDLRFSVLLADGCTEQQRADVLMALARAAPGASPRFVSKAEALHAMRASLGDLGSVLDDLPQNPLRDAIELPAVDAADLRFDWLARAVAGLPCVDDVDYGAKWLGPAARLLRGLRVGVGALFALVVSITVVLVSNTCRLAVYARREEIGILKLVGGTDGFVRGPFLLEGLLEGLCGGLVAALALCFGFSALWPHAVSLAPALSSLGAHPFSLWRAGLECTLFGGGLGLLASGLAVGRFLRV